VTLKAVVFDWGGTLTEPLEVLLGREEMWLPVAEKLVPTRSAEMLERLIEAESDLWELSRTEHKSAKLSDLLARAAQRIGVDVAETLLEETVQEHLGTYAPHVRHDPDAEPVLRRLKELGLRLGLLSNTLWPGSFHDGLLERDGLDRHLDAKLYTSEMPFTKPHGGAFGAILEALGIEDPGEAAFVGDRPWDDIYGAQNAGLRTVLRPNDLVPAYDVEPDARIDDLPSLIPVVESWM
jgi:putative hydrolase of the HAD superfamily